MNRSHSMFLAAAAISVALAGCGESIAGHALALDAFAPGSFSDSTVTTTATLAADLGCPSLDDARATVNDTEAELQPGGWTLATDATPRCRQPLIHGELELPENVRENESESAGVTGGPIDVDFVLEEGGDVGQLVVSEPTPLAQALLDGDATMVRAGEPLAIRIEPHGELVETCHVRIWRNDDLITDLINLLTLQPSTPFVDETFPARNGRCDVSVPSATRPMSASVVVDFALAVRPSTCDGFASCTVTLHRTTSSLITVID